MEGSCIKEMNGIYRKSAALFGSRESRFNSPNSMIPQQAHRDDEKTGLFNISLSHFDSDYKRPFYRKCNGNSNDNRWILYYQNRTREWIFDSKGTINTNAYHNDDVIIGDACCNDHAIYPTHINMNNKWKIWIKKENKYIPINTIKISEIDILSQIVTKIPSQHLIKFIANEPSQTFSKQNQIISADDHNSENHQNHQNLNGKYYFKKTKKNILYFMVKTLSTKRKLN